MAITVPPKQITHIRMLLELPDEKIEQFLDALNKAGPKFNVYDLAEEVSRSVSLTYDLTLDIIRVLASLYITRKSRQPIEKFVDEEVSRALKRAKTFSAEGEEIEWKKLRRFLVAALSLERTVGTTAKAGLVLTEHERIFSGARIMTDLRPIFHVNLDEKPEAAMIVHMLKISQRDQYGGASDQYYALDSNDIILMKEIFERALKKEKTLKAIMRDSGLTILDPKAHF